MDFFKTRTGKALLGVLVALGVLAGTLLNDADTPAVDEPVTVEVQQEAN